MYKLIKISSLCFTAGVFLAGAINLYPCAAGTSTALQGKKSCHSASAHDSDAQNDQQKKAKPCCSLHCYNPALIEPLVKMLPPAIVAVGVYSEEIPFISLTVSPPLPPPRILV